MIAGPPPPDARIPDRLRALAAGTPIRPVWRNELGGLTVAFADRYAKWAPTGSGLDLAAEAVRLRWAAPYTTVPPVLAEGTDADGSWLVTAALAGTNAVTAGWRARPAKAVTALGAGLRALHDALPVDGCPFDWGVTARLAAAEPVPLAVAPPVDLAVVCHGDACAPNTLLDDDGRCTGHVDLGRLGVADRWADIAVATWSLEWNYGPGFDRQFLDAYGVAPDPGRTAYYRLLWDAT